MVKVLIIESERGWGQSVVERRSFPDRKRAEAFCKNFNEQNNKLEVPDWYEYARIEGE